MTFIERLVNFFNPSSSGSNAETASVGEFYPCDADCPLCSQGGWIEPGKSPPNGFKINPSGCEHHPYCTCQQKGFSPLNIQCVVPKNTDLDRVVQDNRKKI